MRILTNKTMNKLPKLHLLANTFQYRPAINCIKIEKGKAIVTDGNILVVYNKLHDYFDKKVLEFIDGKLIDCNVWKIICECELFNITSGQFSCLHKGVWVSFPYLSQVNENYPDWKNVVPKKINSDLNTIGLNVNYLAKLKTVFRSSYVPIRLEIDKPTTAMRFYGEDYYKGYFDGMLMPVVLNSYA